MIALVVMLGCRAILASVWAVWVVLGGLGRRWEVMLDHWTILASAVWVVGRWLRLIVGEFWLLLRWFGWF